MVRIIHMADIHLGARPYGFQERWTDILEAFEDAMRKAVEERPDAIVIAGDKPENSVVKHAVKVLRMATGRGIPVVAAHGEHDTPGRRDSTILQVLEAAVEGFHAPLPQGPRGAAGIVKGQAIRLGAVTILVYPFSKVDLETRRKLAGALLPAFSRLADSLEGPKVFLAHFSLDTVFPIDAVASPSELPPVDYVALGHVHMRHIDVDEKPPYAYTGVLDPLNIAEARARYTHGPLLVDIEGDGVEVQEIPVEVRPQLEVEGEARRLEEAVRIIRRASMRKTGGKPPLVHVRLRVHPGIPLRSLYQEAASVQRSTGVLVRVAPERVDPEAGKVIVGRDAVDPLELLTGDMGLPRGAASLILELKEALLEGDEDRVQEVLEKLAGYERMLGRWL